MTLTADTTQNSIRQKARRYLAPVLFLLTDYMAVILTGQMSTSIYDLSIHRAYLYFWLPLTFLLFLVQSKIYNTMQPFIYTVRSIFYGISYAMLACVAALYFFTSWQASRSFFIVFWLLMLITIYCERLAVSFYLKHRHHLYEDVIMIGAGKTAERALHFFKDDLGYRYNIAGFIDDNPISDKIPKHYNLLGTVDEAEQIIKSSHAQTVIITAPGMERDKLQHLITTVQPHVRHLSYVPDLIGTPMADVEAQSLFSEEILMLHMRNNLALRRNRFYKRVFDLTLTTIGGLAISPILLALAICIKLDSKGSVFYNADRIGKDGRNFKCYKFRSMHANGDEILKDYLAKNPDAAEEWKKYAKLRDYDPRVTKAGAWMRKYSLDELPQILNVIKGDMSLVGPRPYLPREKADIGKDLSTITMSLPGITGYWQVSGRNDVSFQERVTMDTWYVRNWSVWLDIMYLAKTFTAVLFGKGAY
ncbi:undecaprenyl-phosphate galactose phosphotransferase WbaP [Selenomonas ruminantium]|uniref:Undecaprenyl-phosphate galactose phosphotransferase n=1 Tax=Selenomonas ruminantium TaxID=971 RepID=A0A1H0V341_SELRU|nr:undecaprenyl-phosphate galactose phosphotransferase WbaP [Selenomonas ruminantium]SDP72608.1 undecaprenyl-phosphate galactose phosphotransferase [Selenomonas ruminantium]